MAEKSGNLTEYLPYYQMTFDELRNVGVKTVSQLTGNPSLIDKESLKGVPFIIVDFTVRLGDYIRAGSDEKSDYISVTVKTVDNELLVFNDGGVGIMGQLASTTMQDLPIYCPNGLRASEYDGPYGPASTYYLT